MKWSLFILSLKNICKSLFLVELVCWVFAAFLFLAVIFEPCEPMWQFLHQVWGIFSVQQEWFISKICWEIYHVETVVLRPNTPTEEAGIQNLVGIIHSKAGGFFRGFAATLWAEKKKNTFLTIYLLVYSNAESLSPTDLFLLILISAQNNS